MRMSETMDTVSEVQTAVRTSAVVCGFIKSREAFSSHDGAALSKFYQAHAEHLAARGDFWCKVNVQVA